MKNLFRAAAAISALALSTSAFAQQAAGKAEPKFGLGVGLSTRNDAVGGPGSLIFVPINATPQIRIEPYVGWVRSDTDGTGKASDFTLGVGAFFLQPVAPQVQLYAGGRLASNWVSDKVPPPGDLKHERRDTLLGVAAGGEYVPVPRVAVGAEVMVAYVSVGDTKTTTAAGSAEGGGGSGSFTQGTLFVRVYLF